MVKKELEIDGKTVAVDFRTPTRADRREWLKHVAQIGVEASKIDLKKTENGELAVEFLERVERKRCEMLLALCQDKQLSKVEDFDRMSQPTLKSLFDWFDDATGVSAKSEGFTKP